MKRDNIILLDLDGVLITTNPWEADEMHEDGYSDFNRRCVDNLNKILDETGYDIILSSARRVEVHRLVMNGYFRNRGIKKTIKEYVPIYREAKTRREEIECFINEYKPENYIIIDDDKSLLGASEEVKSNWIQTEFHKGLSGYNGKYLTA